MCHAASASRRIPVSVPLDPLAALIVQQENRQGPGTIAGVRQWRRVDKGGTTEFRHIPRPYPGPEVAFGWLWGGLGVAWGSHEGRMKVACGSQSPPKQMACRWLWGGLGWLADPEFHFRQFVKELRALEFLRQVAVGRGFAEFAGVRPEVVLLELAAAFVEPARLVAHRSADAAQGDHLTFSK